MSNDYLTFAEAMALGSSEVEVKRDGGPWNPLHDGYTLGYLRQPGMDFRRARPRRSRVQEMAVHFDNNRANETTVDTMTEVIRVVCEYLRTERIGVLAAAGPEGAEHAWSNVERHFLEPR